MRNRFILPAVAMLFVAFVGCDKNTETPSPTGSGGSGNGGSGGSGGAAAVCGDGAIDGDVNTRGDNPGEMGDALPAIDLGVGKFAKSIAPGRDHVCAMLNDDTLKCWGSAVFGQLGLGDLNHRGDNPGEMGDALPAVSLK